MRLSGTNRRKRVSCARADPSVAAEATMLKCRGRQRFEPNQSLVTRVATGP